MTGLRRWFRQLPTAGKLFILLTAAVLPLGLVLAGAASRGIAQGNAAIEARANDQARAAIRAVDGLIARHILALRVAATTALAGTGDPCEAVAQSLRLAPRAPRDFVLRDSVGTELCSRGTPDTAERPTLLVPPGQVRSWISQGKRRLYFRAGVYGGSVTGSIDQQEFADTLDTLAADLATLIIEDGNGDIRIAGKADGIVAEEFGRRTIQLGRSLVGGQLQTTARITAARVAPFDRLIVFLPLAMWIVAGILSWLVVRALLLSPLKRIQQAIAAHEPGSGALELPPRLGSAVEIRDLGGAFVRAIERIERSEVAMGEALEGQRRLVREVHHRVKNNLQVIASLLNIHRRTAGSEEAKDAYTAIGRRVDALAVVHRNHFAELEDNLGIALRPLLSELSANLRGSAPETARGLDITVELDILHTTQDVAVAAAFFTTEIVEHAMLTQPSAPVHLTLRRVGDLTARFTIRSEALSPDLAEREEHRQFERIIAGLAKQLRSALDKEEGAYSIELPVFPPTRK